MSFRLTPLALSLFLYSLVSSQCLSGEAYYARRDVCYSVSSQTKPFLDGRAICTSRAGGGDLASIHDDDQNNFIQNELLLQNAPNYFWIGGEFVDQKWGWSDGSPWNYTNWYPSEPRSPLMFTYMFKGDGKWISNSDQLMYFVCAGPPMNTPTTLLASTTVSVTCPACPTTTECARCNCPTTVSPITSSTSQPSMLSTKQPVYQPACPSSWTYFSGTDSCYTVFFSASWDSAEELCGELGGHLTSIHSFGENAFVAKLTKTFLNATEPLQMTWTGLNYESGLWRWSDASPVDFINWAAKEPTDPSGKRCAMISQDGSTQAWFTADCASNMRAYVCQKRTVH